MMLTRTGAARPTKRRDPKVLLAIASWPPPQAVMPTFMRLIPISVTTMPETRGVMMCLVYFNTRLMAISTLLPTMQAPKTVARPPESPAEMMGPMKEKLVPWMQSSPQPTGPMRRHWMKVEIPEAISAVETSVLVVSMSACRAPAMMSGGVMMATKMASRCCKAAKRASRRGGRSSSP